SGAGVVVLRRLADAQADGDVIHAVIRGSAINNDGSRKLGFTAPSVDGQADVIAEALAVAGVEPRTISYIEAHGTGTPLGDPVEVAALRSVFGSVGSGRIALGSVKTNVGHLDTAAGVIGLIKTVLAMNARELPPSLHLRTPNARLELDGSPFGVNTELIPWTGEVLRAGVSSFGIGGTNAHVVLESAPPRPASSGDGRRHLLPLSAASPAALDASAARLAARLESESGESFADIAFTLQQGRWHLPYRRFVVAADPAEAAAALTAAATPRHSAAEYRVVFAFPGQGPHQPACPRPTRPAWSPSAASSCRRPPRARWSRYRYPRPRPPRFWTAVRGSPWPRSTGPASAWSPGPYRLSRRSRNRCGPAESGSPGCA